MTKREKAKTEQAKKILYDVLTFLTVERNEQHGNTEKQKEFNDNINKIRKSLDLIKAEN